MLKSNTYKNLDFSHFSSKRFIYHYFRITFSVNGFCKLVRFQLTKQILQNEIIINLKLYKFLFIYTDLFSKYH